jgi:hypothetical protein
VLYEFIDSLHLKFIDWLNAVGLSSFFSILEFLDYCIVKY